MAAFRLWRRSRPFWAGASILLGAGIIVSIPTAGSSLGVVFTEGIAGISGVLIALMLAVAGLTCWVSPAARVFAGIAACFLAVVAVVASNLGGFLFGTVFGLVGGAMAVGWSADGGTATDRVRPQEPDCPAHESMLPMTPGADHRPPSRSAGGLTRAARCSLLLAVPALVSAPMSASARPAARAVDARLLAELIASSDYTTTLSGSYDEALGTRYDGVTTYDGRKVLEFHFDSDLIDNMVMRSNSHEPDAPDIEITATKLLLSGDIDYYTTSLGGTLYGLVPVTFTPDFPPPISVPTLIATNMHSDVVLATADTMDVEGLRLTIVPPGH